MRLSLSTSCAFLTFLVAPVFAASVTQYSDLVVFGDSLSDTGNVSIATFGQFPGPNYAPGRFTNGPNTTPATSGPVGLWVDQLATKLSVADPQPFLAGTGGTDYAFASAMTGSNGLYNVSDQVSYFVGQHATGASPTALYAIWGGANDLFFGNNTPATAPSVADSLAANIKTLAAAGAKNFLWVNLPPLGLTPRGGSSSTLVQESLAFNQEWAVDIAQLQGQGINVVGVDVFSLFLQIAQNPGAHGFTNITDPAQGLSGVNPNQYLFWDTEHPTTAGHALVADLAYNDLTASPTPEPMSVAITALGFSVLLAGARIRRYR